MFNSIQLNTNSQTVQLNTPCTGILQRSNPNSTFIRFQKGSQMEREIFPSSGDIPYLTSGSSTFRKKIIILQVLIFGDNQFLVEVLEFKHLEKES